MNHVSKPDCQPVAKPFALKRPAGISGGWWIIVLVMFTQTTAWSQTDAQNDASRQVVDAEEIKSIMAQPTPGPASDQQPSGVDLLSLMLRGGAFMVPIALMSLMVVALSVERVLSLRRTKIMPAALVTELTELASPIDKFNPAVAMKRCEEFPSPLARVASTMLGRTGQPLADVERATADAIMREADQQAATIRWLTLAAAATPLMGLLGTVWGMILAFHQSTTLTVGRSRSEQLSEGIYTALVTTLAGLAVAIPAAILALYLENRLSKLFHQMEAFLQRISPGLVRFTGRQQLDASGVLKPITNDRVPLPSETNSSETNSSETNSSEIGSTSNRQRDDGQRDNGTRGETLSQRGTLARSSGGGAVEAG